MHGSWSIGKAAARLWAWLQAVRGPLFVCVALLAGVSVIYGQTTSFEFVNYDDNFFVTDNWQVRRGLTPSGIAYAFTHTVAGNWAPLSVVSHMADVQLFGLRAGGHHLVSVVLHGIASCLLFLAWRRLTGAVLRSAVVAALFAWHPLHVESVAWVAERRDVLSGLFFMATLLAYVSYVEHRTLKRYVLVVLCFGLGLLAKPMLVTLPFVLLLLDYWPLARRDSARALAGEKAPLFFMAAVASVVTFVVQTGSGALVGNPTILERLATAAIAYATYAGRTFVPVGLSVLYPRPAAWPLWQPVVALLALALVSAFAVLGRARRPWLLVGWLWFLGTLVPVIGLVQIGRHAYTDRYTYLPLIGVFVAVAWLGHELLAAAPRARAPAAAAATVLGAALIGSSWRQTQSWRDSVTLFGRALACEGKNALAHNNLGHELVRLGRADEGLAHFEAAIGIDPEFQEAYVNIGSALFHRGQVADAERRFREGLRLSPREFHANDNLGQLLWMRGERERAMGFWQVALEARPDAAETLNNLAWALATSPEPALRDGRRAVRLAAHACAVTDYQRPQLVGTLAAAYAEAGRFREAVATVDVAARLAMAGGDQATARAFGHLRSAFSQGMAWRDAPRPVSP